MINYFPHDVNARNDEKLLSLRMDLGAEGFGVYWMLLEKLAAEKDHRLELNLKKLAWDMHVEEATIENVIMSYDLFEVGLGDGLSYFWSKRLCEHARQIDDVQQARSRAGKASAEAKSRKATCAQQMQSGTATCVEHVLEKPSTEENKINKNKTKENIIKEKSSSSEDAHEREEEAAEAAEEESNVCTDIWELYEKACAAVGEIRWPEGTVKEDILRVTHWLTTPNDDDRKTLKMIIETELGQGRDVLHILNLMNIANRKRPIYPIPKTYFDTMAYLSGLNSKDAKAVKEAVGLSMRRWADLIMAVKECQGNEKIKQPGRFILSRIK